jgi:Uma2 family endonuclease
MEAMVEVSFESVTTVTQPEFAEWCRQRATADPNHYELLNGRIVMNPPAGYPHGSIGARVIHLLSGHAAAARLGEVLDSSQGFELPSGDTAAPDASFVSAARWSAMPPPEAGRYLRVVPDLTVEIQSRSTASRDRGEKKAIYERNGVREYWLVDPVARTLVVFGLDAEAARFDAGRLLEATEEYRAGGATPPLPGLCFPVESLFPPR